MQPSHLQSDQLRRLRELFAEALELPPDARPAFCSSACGEDVDLRAELEGLLEVTPHADDDFLATPVMTVAQDLDPEAMGPPRSSPPPATIGPYRIIERLGSGGMGVVYLAEQTQPLRRQVALKIIKPGMDTERVVARFEVERQALARMDHPGIARIYDAGATPEGRPFFVMQLVQGEPIDAFCERRSLSIRARLVLFCKVCDAIQHAHQKGVVHRDLKPSNILAVERDGEFDAVVIDFGIAQATSTSEFSVVETRGQEVVGTLDYMAPEQTVEANGTADIDSRTDIYSLGVLLYQLLTGELPFAHELPAGLQQSIEARTPISPSVRVRRAKERPHSRVLRSELDWVTLKAIEPERDRRYPTASELAADVRRYLADQPVTAGPPGIRYRLRSTVRRHRRLVAAGALSLAGILTGTVAAVFAWSDALDQRDVATSAQRRAERTADLMIDWLVSVNHETDPNESLPVLDRFAAELDALIVTRPRDRASLHRALGQAYSRIAAHERATDELGRAVQLLEDLPDMDPAERYEVLHLRRWAANGAERPLLGSALKLSTRTAAQSLFVDDHPDLSRSLIRIWQKNSTNASQLEFEGLRAACAKLQPQDPRWVAVADYLVDHVTGTPDAVDRLGWLEFASTIYREKCELGSSTTRRLRLDRARLRALAKRNRFDAVVAEGRAVLARYRAVWPGHHWLVQDVRDVIASAHLAEGDLEAAESMFEQITSIERRHERRGRRAAVRGLLGLLRVDEARGPGARSNTIRNRLVEEASRGQRALSLPELRLALDSRFSPLLDALDELDRANGWPVGAPNGKPDLPARSGSEAPVELLNDALRIWKESLDAADPRAAIVASTMLDTVEDWDNQRRGPAATRALLPWMDHSIDALRSASAPLLETALFWRARLYRQLDRFAESERDANAALAWCESIAESTLAPTHLRTLAECALGQGRDDGLHLLRDAYAGLVVSVGEDNNNTETAFSSLLTALLAHGRRQEADRRLADRLRRLIRLGGGISKLWNTAQMANRLPDCGTETHRLSRSAAQRASDVLPNDWRAQIALAGAAFRLGDHDVAVREARRCVANRPELAEAHALLALALATRGETRVARESLEEARRLPPGRDRSFLDQASELMR